MRKPVLCVCLLIALLGAAVPAIAEGKVYARDPATQKLRYKPTTLRFADAEFTGLAWTSFGASTTTARGINHINDCKPDCAGGKIVDVATTVTLTKIRRQGKQGHKKRVYSCMKWRDDQQVVPPLPSSGSLNPKSLSPC